MMALVKSSAKDTPASKKPAKKSGPLAAKKASAKKAPAKKALAKKAAPPKKPAPRADLGTPIDSFFGKQPAHLRVVLEALRKMIEDAAPDADSAIKWGMPFYTLNGTPVCALAGHTSHVGLILHGPPEAFEDPDGRLSGDGKTGRRLKLTSLDGLPRAAVQRWLREAAARARS